MAAVLVCGDAAVLSHAAAAALWKLEPDRPGTIDVSTLSGGRCRQAGIRVHRRSNLSPAELTVRFSIPVTTPGATLVDLASFVSRERLEAAVNAADRRDLIDPEALRAYAETVPRRPGVAALKRTLDRHTFRSTDSWLERRFLALVQGAGLPIRETQQWINGYRVDFYWRELGLIVETDGLRYHRTAAQQAEDQRRDQAHAAAGLERLRFSPAQIRYQPNHVVEMLTRVIRRLASSVGAD